MTKAKIRDLVFGYDEQNLIVDGLSLFYETPDVLCVLGANGAGKSTLLQCLTGGLKPASGSISINGAALGSYSARTLARLIVYIPQTHVLSFGFSVLDVVTMGRTSRMDYIATPGPTDVHVAQEQLAYLGISHLCGKPYTEISGGERQLVMIAAALVQEPELLVLDEPTAHLDFGNQYRFLPPPCTAVAGAWGWRAHDYARARPCAAAGLHDRRHARRSYRGDGTGLRCCHSRTYGRAVRHRRVPASGGRPSPVHPRSDRGLRWV